MALGPDSVGVAVLDTALTEDQYALARANALERKIDAWLEFGDPKKSSFFYPLPYFAHEGSAVLKHLIPRYQPLWRNVRLIRGDGCLKLVFEK